MGGFPEDGFFYANHNELVGKFSNGKTAVANNEQITDGIKQAVIEGMSEVFANANIGQQNGSDIDNPFPTAQIQRLLGLIELRKFLTQSQNPLRSLLWT